MGRAEGRENRIAEGKREGFASGFAEGFASGFAEGFAASFVEGFAEGERTERERALAAMREAGFDEETRRREDALARRVWRNMRDAL